MRRNTFSLYLNVTKTLDILVSKYLLLYTLFYTFLSEFVILLIHPQISQTTPSQTGIIHINLLSLSHWNHFSRYTIHRQKFTPIQEVKDNNETLILPVQLANSSQFAFFLHFIMLSQPNPFWGNWRNHQWFQYCGEIFLGNFRNILHSNDRDSL